ncbi:MAG: hypothetical protein BECKG1743F_GA0114225_100441 [Candidatus Kentron sp. G]|nr:MAG: hypothetical protein BECKG1743F_GA0114225_100441 [Candidatus Kentron sp. G]VFN07210.1 MAG: hypothetical protein BECKG1743E_GA0114224_111571 [Candidatus Kentron sp. G]
MRKGVGDLHRRSQVSQAANERYLDHLAAANVSASLHETVGDIRERTRKDGKSYRALNPWNTQDFQTLQFLSRGEHQLRRFLSKNIPTCLSLSSSFCVAITVT